MFLLDRPSRQRGAAARPCCCSFREAVTRRLSCPLGGLSGSGSLGGPSGSQGDYLVVDGVLRSRVVVPEGGQPCPGDDHMPVCEDGHRDHGDNARPEDPLVGSVRLRHVIGEALKEVL